MSIKGRRVSYLVFILVLLCLSMGFSPLPRFDVGSSGMAFVKGTDVFEVVWEINMPEDSRMQPVTDANGNIYVDAGNFLWKLTDKGEKIWSFDLGGSATGLALFEDCVYVSSDRGMVYSLYPSGEVRWSSEALVTAGMTVRPDGVMIAGCDGPLTLYSKNGNVLGNCFALPSCAT